MAPMVGPPGMILWLTVALVLVVLLLVPGRGRRSRVALAGVTFAAGIVFFSSASQNRRGQSGMAPPAPRRPPAPRVTYEVPPAPAPPPTAIGEQVGVEIQASTSAASAPAVVIRGLPPISGVAEDWLNRFGSPVRFEGSKLIIEGHVPALSAAESSSQPADVEWQQDEERESKEAARQGIVEQLSDYFDNLVAESPPDVPRLRRLRDDLQQLSARQRQRVAEATARLRSVVRRQTITSSVAESGDVERNASKFEIAPEEIESLIRAEIAKARQHQELSTPAKVFGTIGILIGAVVVLKHTTRRHTGLNPGR